MSDSVTGNTLSFDALVQAQAAAMQVSANEASPPQSLTFSPGAILLAIAHAVSGVCLWLQAMCLNLLAYGRASTCKGADLDSWMAQFQFARIPATGATCATVVLSRFSTGQAVSLLPGGIVQTAIGNVQFTIVGDTGQSAWNAAAGAYQINSSTATCQVTVQAATLGTGGNVGAATITQFASGVLGFDTVSNTAAASGGANAETDPAFLARFWLYLQYLFRGTGPAVQYAIQTIQPGLTVTIQDGVNEAGQQTAGYFVATVDDGTGTPSTQLIAAALAQVNSVRALGIQGACHGPATLTPANIIATVVTNNPLVDGPAAYSAAMSFLQSVVLGQGVSYFKIGAAMQNASASIQELANLTLNGLQSDIVGAPTQKVTIGTITVNTEAPS
jgi:hypothetical protein